MFPLYKDVAGQRPLGKSKSVNSCVQIVTGHGPNCGEANSWFDSNLSYWAKARFDSGAKGVAIPR
jgi:hypothetical protein